jgi:hypothetical protein
VPRGAKKHDLVCINETYTPLDAEQMQRLSQLIGGAQRPSSLWQLTIDEMA